MAREEKNIVFALARKNNFEDPKIVGVCKILAELKKTREDPDAQDETEKKDCPPVSAKDLEKERDRSAHDLRRKRGPHASRKPLTLQAI